MIAYHIYLKKGYPIATGLVEGTCGSLVKDRMEQSGMRWSIKGAQAVLSKARCDAKWRLGCILEILHPNRNYTQLYIKESLKRVCEILHTHI